MASEKFLREYSAVIANKQRYVDELNNLIHSSMEEQEKKNSFILFLKKN